ncbi:hypothetical protein FOI67_11195 [Geobacillus sp. LEMMJ02]|nr:hypothetical protein E5Z46_14075 [Geobacillus kaustophilus NBRC 102445]TRY42459.1 hypothetical protein FOI67_11195 [Geobacillus sp. LEMMJ02]
MGVHVLNADFRQHRCQRRKHRRQQSINDPHAHPFAFIENFSHLLYYEKGEHFTIFPFVCYNGGQAPLLAPLLRELGVNMSTGPTPRSDEVRQLFEQFAI